MPALLCAVLLSILGSDPRVLPAGCTASTLNLAEEIVMGKSSGSGGATIGNTYGSGRATSKAAKVSGKNGRGGQPGDHHGYDPLPPKPINPIHHAFDPLPPKRPK